MERAIPFACAAVLLWGPAVAGPRSAPAQRPAVPVDVSGILTHAATFTAAEIAALQAGQVITQTETSPENLEASVVSAVRIATTQTRALDYFRRLVSYVDGHTTLGYGTFGRSLTESDLSGLALDAEVADLRACHPDNCEIRIGATSQAEVARAVDWTAPDVAKRANAWVRRQLVSYVSDYLQNGDAGLVARDDRGVPVNQSDQWRALLARSQMLSMLTPGLEHYLAGPPAASLPSEAREEFYWDKQRYAGLKPVIGITQLVTWRDPTQPDRVVVAQKQIFASHYIYGSLAVTLILQDATSTTPITYIVYANRLRGDLLNGTRSPAQTGVRAKVSSLGANLQRQAGDELIKQSAERLMRAMKEALER